MGGSWNAKRLGGCPAPRRKRNGDVLTQSKQSTCSPHTNGVKSEGGGEKEIKTGGGDLGNRSESIKQIGGQGGEMKGWDVTAVFLVGEKITRREVNRMVCARDQVKRTCNLKKKHQHEKGGGGGQSSATSVLEKKNH